MTKVELLIPDVRIEKAILLIRGHKVMLDSERAIDVNIAIMRAFVRLRQILSTNKDLAAKLEKLEHKLGEHDENFRVVFKAIRQLMAPPPAAGKKRRIGFHDQ